MSKQNVFDDSKDEAPTVIAVSDLLAPFWQARWTVLIITVFAIVCGVAWSLLDAKYKSHGFLQFGGAIPVPVLKQVKETDKEKEKGPGIGIALADFKRYSASYATGERFAEYIQEKKLTNAPGVDELSRTINREGLARIIEPIYPFTKLDAKELMEQPKDSSNNVIGLRINYEGSTPEIAQKIVGLLGNYAMDSIIYLTYSDALRFKREEMNTRIIKLDNDIIASKIRLEEYRRRAAELRQIVARNPGAESQATRQVVTVTEENARYLPPATQLATTEVQAAEANEAILKARREQQQNILYLEYYDKAKGLLDSTRSGETILRGLESAKTAVFKDKNLEDDVTKEIYNKITVENRDAINIYLDRSRFIAGPTLAPKSTARPALALAMSLILGLILAVVIVLFRKQMRLSQVK